MIAQPLLRRQELHGRPGKTGHGSCPRDDLPRNQIARAIVGDELDSETILSGPDSSGLAAFFVATRPASGAIKKRRASFATSNLKMDQVIIIT